MVLDGDMQDATGRQTEPGRDAAGSLPACAAWIVEQGRSAESHVRENRSSTQNTSAAV